MEHKNLNFVIWNIEGERKTCFYDDDQLDSMFTEISRGFAFSDLDESYEIEFIYANGHVVHYMGWAPGMFYQYADENENTVWCGSFPEWDH